MRFILFLSIVIFCLFQSCSRIEDTDQSISIYLNSYKLCFPDYNGKGFYLVDNRNLLKFKLYYFSIDSNKWSAVSDGNGISEPMEFGSLISIDNVKIRLMGLNEYRSPWSFNDPLIIYEYSITENSWLKLKTIPGNYSNQVQYTSGILNNLYNKAAYEIVDSTMFLLDENFNWIHKADLHLIPTDDYHYQFCSADTLIFFSKNGFFKLDISGNIISQMNSGQTDSTITGLTSSSLINNNIAYPRTMDPLSGQPYFFNKIELHPFAIAKLNFEVTAYMNTNPLDVHEGGVYQTTPAFNYFASYNTDKFYVFIGDIGYAYSEANQSWTRLPYLDYVSLNKK